MYGDISTQRPVVSKPISDEAARETMQYNKTPAKEKKQLENGAQLDVRQIKR